MWGRPGGLQAFSPSLRTAKGREKNNPQNLEVKTNENDEAGFILFV